jgi:hypothetical protein
MLKNIMNNMVVVTIEDCYANQSRAPRLTTRIRELISVFQRAASEKHKPKLVNLGGEFDPNYETNYLRPGGPKNVIRNTMNRAMYDYNLYS